MPDFDYDVVVIGSGPGGYVAAIRAAQHGLKTACVEKRDRLGGTCLNVGCIPSKSLLHATEYYDEAKGGHLAKFGITFPQVDFDLSVLMAEKDKAVAELTDGVAFLFKKNKVEWIKGSAAFVDAKSITVGERTITAKNFIIATGSEVASLPGVTPDGEVIVTSTEALALPTIPKHLVVIGGGYIGLEMGSVWRRLGSQVTVIEYAPQIVPAMDAEIGKAFARILQKQGMELRTGMKVVEARREGAGAVVVVEPTAGGPREEIAADIVLLSTGRRPNTDGLNIEATGLTLDRGRVMVADDFSTTVPGLWAIGDVVPGPMLAHKAEDEGVACADNIAGLNGQVNHAGHPGGRLYPPRGRHRRPHRGGAEGRGHRLQGRQIPVQRQQPRQGQSRHRRAGEGACGRGYRPRARRPHHRRGRGHDDRRGRAGNGVRRVVGGYRPHLPRPPDPHRGTQGSGDGRDGQADPYVMGRTRRVGARVC